MKLIYEYQSGQMTYGAEYELAGSKVIRREIRYATGEPRQAGNTTRTAFASAALAEKFLRLQVAGAQQSQWKLVEGVAPTLDPNENFRDVKEKTKAYRYLEHSDGRFVDLDLDVTVLLVTRGKRGEPGESANEEFNWDGETSAAFSERTMELISQGFTLKEGALSKKELKQLEKKPTPAKKPVKKPAKKARR